MGKHKPARYTIQVSHGADPGNWFVVKPQPGQEEVPPVGEPIRTNEMAVQSLLNAGRAVYELTLEPWQLDERIPRLSRLGYYSWKRKKAVS